MSKHCVAVVACLLVGGCALSSDPSNNRPRSATARTPASEFREGTGEPVQIFLSRGTPTDSDADGYADTIPVIVYLFPEAEVSQVPVWAEGEFEFRLMDQDQRLVARWIFPAEIARGSRKKLPPGPAYSFFLRLGGDDDRMERASLELSGVFRSASGRTISSQGSAAVQLGSG